MKNISRMLSLLLMLAMMVACFAGCGDSHATSAASTGDASVTEIAEPAEEPAEEPAPAEEPESAVEELAEAPTTVADSPFVNVPVELPLCDEVTSVTVWTYLLPPIIDHVAADYSQNISYDYLERITNVHADVNAISLFQATENLTLSIAAGDLCDITVGMQQMYPNGVESVYDAGLLVDLVTYQELMPNYFGILEADPDLYRDVLTDEGVLPYFYQLDECINIPQGLVIRSDWVSQVGMEIPQTYDELHDVLIAIKNQLDVPYPLWFSYTGGTVNSFLANGFGVSNSDFYLAVDGEVKFSPLESGFYEYLSLMNTWYSEGLISPDFVNGTLDSMPDDDKMGDYAIYLINRSGYGNIYNVAPDAEITPIPDMVKEVGDTHHISGSSGARARNLGAAVSADASDIELCCKYLDYYYTQEGTYAAFFGEPGVTYELDENGEPQYTDLIANHPDLALSFAALTLCEQQSAGILLSGMDFILYGQDVVDAMDVWASTVDEDTWDYPPMAKLTQEENEAYSGLFSDIETYVREMMLKFIIGTASLENEYEDFLQTLDSMGLQQCIDYKQAALDRYYAR